MFCSLTFNVIVGITEFKSTFVLFYLYLSYLFLFFFLPFLCSFRIITFFKYSVLSPLMTFYLYLIALYFPLLLYKKNMHSLWLFLEFELFLHLRLGEEIVGYLTLIFVLNSNYKDIERQDIFRMTASKVILLRGKKKEYKNNKYKVQLKLHLYYLDWRVNIQIYIRF